MLVIAETQATMDLIAVGDAVRKDVVTQHGRRMSEMSPPKISIQERYDRDTMLLRWDANGRPMEG